MNLNDIIHKNIDFQLQQWTLEVGQPGNSKTVATFIGVPPPRIGDTIMHEDINGPMTVIAVIWGIHRKYPYAAEVFTDCKAMKEST